MDSARWLLIAVAAALLAALSGFFYGRHVEALACDVRVAGLEAAFDKAKDEAVADAQARADAQRAAFAASDQKRTEELAYERSQNDALRADLAAGRKRLLVSARCPAPAGVSEGRSGTGLDDAAAPRLEGAAEQDYLTLVDRLEQMEKQLLGLQDRERVRQAAHSASHPWTIAANAPSP